MTRSPILPTRSRRAVALAMLGAASCAEAAPTVHEVQVSVTSDGTSPVAGAQIRVRGQHVGTTNALGRATLSVPGKAGEALRVALSCPDGYLEPASESPLQLAAAGAPSAEAALTLGLTCELQLREAVVLVHAAGGATSMALPVKVDGVRVGQTDALGFAHVHVRAAPNSEFEVSLDTSANERLSPVNPAQRFRLERHDELFVLDATFREAKARNRRGAKRRTPKPSDG